MTGAPTVSFGQSGANILLRVTGVAATNINWVSKLEFMMVVVGNPA